MSRVPIETLETTITTVANKATWTGSAVTFVGGITSSDLGVYAGIVIGIAGLVISWYFKHRAEIRHQQANKRYEEAHAAYMAKLNTVIWVEQPIPPKQEVPE